MTIRFIYKPIKPHYYDGYSTVLVWADGAAMGAPFGTPIEVCVKWDHVTNSEIYGTLNEGYARLTKFVRDLRQRSLP